MKSFLTTLVLCIAFSSSAVSAADFSDAELVELGQAYALAVNELDVGAFDRLISARHLAQNVAEIAGDSEAEKEELFRQFEKTIPTINERMMVEFERQQAWAVFLRVHEFDGMRGPLVRYSVGEGYNYVLLLPVRPARAARGAQIGDLFYATTGELLSESLGIATKLVSSPSETFLGKLFGTKVANDELVRAFKQVGELRQQNRLREAYDVLDQVQGGARNHRLILANTIQIAAQLDEDLYRAELKRLATYHKDDPRAAFTLLDHYFLENDLDSAMAVVDLMEQTYGQDAVFFIFRANVDAARGRFDTAANYAEKAVQMEPGNEDAYWTMLTLLVQSEKFAEGVEIVQLLENEFGYFFMREDFEAEPLYADFARSAEFARWIEAPGR